jgi:hypothetical protein
LAGFALVPASIAFVAEAQACETSGCGPEPGFYPDPIQPQEPIISEVFNLQDIEGTGTGGGSNSLRVGTSVRPEATTRIVAKLDDAFQFCAALESREYAVDCITERLEQIAEALPSTGDYAPVRSALAQATSQLDDIVERNRSPVLPTATARSTVEGGEATSRPLRPTATERTDEAVAQAVAVLQETRTVLLLDSDSQEQAEAFRSVSDSIETGTVLLFAV